MGSTIYLLRSGTYTDGYTVSKLIIDSYYNQKLVIVALTETSSTQLDIKTYDQGSIQTVRRVEKAHPTSEVNLTIPTNTHFYASNYAFRWLYLNQNGG